MASVGNMTVTVTVDKAVLDALDALEALATRVQVLENRLDHMQDRLDRQGARLRHIEHLYGGRETLPPAENLATVNLGPARGAVRATAGE